MRVMPRAGLVLAAVLALGAGRAQAGMFDDEEARKAILDLRTRVQTNDESAKARSAELAQANAQLLEQLQQLRRSLVEMNSQLELQRGEMAKLRGQQEQLAKDVADLQRRQKDVVQGVEDRLRKLEPQAVSIDGKEVLVDPEERRAHDDAMAVLRGGDFDKAATALAGFLRRYPGSAYEPSVRFALGNALYARKDYKEAIASFRALVGATPEHARAPEALLAIASCQAEMKDPKAARRTLDELVKTYPKSEAAAAGKERLAGLKG